MSAKKLNELDFDNLSEEEEYAARARENKEEEEENDQHRRIPFPNLSRVDILRLYAHANCDMGDTETFFLNDALAVKSSLIKCRHCPVAGLCLKYAIQGEWTIPRGSRYGIYGGRGPEERWAIENQENPGEWVRFNHYGTAEEFLTIWDKMVEAGLPDNVISALLGLPDEYWRDAFEGKRVYRHDIKQAYELSLLVNRSTGLTCYVVNVNGKPGITLGNNLIVRDGYKARLRNKGKGKGIKKVCGALREDKEAALIFFLATRRAEKYTTRSLANELNRAESAVVEVLRALEDML